MKTDGRNKKNKQRQGGKENKETKNKRTATQSRDIATPALAR